MKKIPLTQGKFAIVDDCDYKRLSEHKWQAVKSAKSAKTWYARRCLSGTKTYIKMQHAVLGVDRSVLVDHRNRNGLKNTRDNLRVCTLSQNSINRGMLSSNTSGYRGVAWSKQDKKWKSTIMLDGVSKHLGYFFCLIKAAKAYDKAASDYYGEFAYQNFKNNKRDAIVSRKNIFTMDRGELQKLASELAIENVELEKKIEELEAAIMCMKEGTP